MMTPSSKQVPSRLTFPDGKIRLLMQYSGWIRGFENQFFRAKKHRAQPLHLFPEDIRRAMDNGEFVQHYQPIVNPKTGHITGAEALLRWQHPYLGLLCPDRFLPKVPKYLHKRLGEQVIDSALSSLQTIRSTCSDGFRVSVNINAVQLEDTKFPKHVLSKVRQQGLCPKSLEFEVLEDVNPNATFYTSYVLKRLHDYGFSIALDDFGAGKNRLSALRTLPIDRIKIDRSLVKTERPVHWHICKSLITSAKALGLRVTAEGVETKEQLTRLKSYGPVEIQGFYFHRPMPLDQLMNKLSQQSSESTQANMPVAV
ncbi:EAL domain-containing protein [Rhodobacteraceae bacterium RKSG542]|uniref:EAL domain-containing protein n=1 Tax=Pseudovibrio flavus TaxID=2529854 RepID=UPI0012BC9C45|nr:EAL domain-containing protein [Pseudovibrio flavus]MTI17155.1 EAL domain-containing protein [Pseudovibrio flavus]